MSWLSGWLKELIVIIMLASFVDLLLPSRSMERYVKTVISLFILLVLLSPVFKLFQTGWDPDKLIPTAESSQKALAVGGRVTDGGMQELSAILEQADKLKETNAAQAKRLVETQLSGSIQAGIERSLNLRVAEVTSAAELNDANRMEIKSVQVWLKPGGAQGGEKSPEAGRTMKPVEPVQPVIIEIRPGRTPPPSSTSPSGEKTDPADAAKIKAFIEREWQIPANRIQVGSRPSE